MEATLLVELLTEELPPKALSMLAAEFSSEIHSGLIARRLDTAAAGEFLETPRRIAARIPRVLDKANDRVEAVIGPSVDAPPQAIAGFARKHGVDVATLEQQDTPKGKVVVAKK